MCGDEADHRPQHQAEHREQSARSNQPEPRGLQRGLCVRIDIASQPEAEQQRHDLHDHEHRPNQQGGGDQVFADIEGGGEHPFELGRHLLQQDCAVDAEAEDGDDHQNVAEPSHALRHPRITLNQVRTRQRRHQGARAEVDVVQPALRVQRKDRRCQAGDGGRPKKDQSRPSRGDGLCPQPAQHTQRGKHDAARAEKRCQQLPLHFRRNQRGGAEHHHHQHAQLQQRHRRLHQPGEPRVHSLQEAPTQAATRTQRHLVDDVRR